MRLAASDSLHFIRCMDWTSPQHPLAPLHRRVVEACQGWSIAVCSRNTQIGVISSLLLEQPVLSGSIAELLGRLPSGASPLLLIADDDLPDGGADLLIEQVREQRRSQPGSADCRALIYLPRAIPDARLQRLWLGGADALLSLESGGSGLGFNAVLELVAGRSCIDPVFNQRLRHPHSVRLRPQEQELILALARGRSTRDIAALRQVRRDSVRRQLCNLYRKTDVHDQQGLLAWGLEHGVLRPPDLACRLHRSLSRPAASSACRSIS